MPAAPAKPYHHGNLRAALLEASLAVLAESGVADFSLREVARRAGVSPTAAYRHFADREALLAALALEGFQQLAASQQKVLARHPGDPAAALQALGEAYIQFAMTHVPVYRLMFSSLFGDKSGHPELRAASSLAFAAVHQVIERGMAEGSFAPGDVRVRAIAGWSTVHGLVTLLFDDLIGRMPAGKRERQAIIRAVVAQFVAGLKRTGR